jgi:hypothetical protein
MVSEVGVMESLASGPTLMYLALVAEAPPASTQVREYNILSFGVTTTEPLAGGQFGSYPPRLSEPIHDVAPLTVQVKVVGAPLPWIILSGLASTFTVKACADCGMINATATKNIKTSVLERFIA